MTDLAIVIPAYKEQYFAEALASLAGQTRKDFTVYIGDDHSPHDLKSIAQKYENDLRIHYTRFADNIGAENLVDQWKRCVALTKGEDWIWLFSDDDLVDASCVESFYRQLEADNGHYDVYRFNNVVIDGEGKVKWATPESPPHERSEEMAYHLLLGKRGNSMADHIFSRKVYDQAGGFVYTRYAQGADWATSMLFSKEKGMVTIPGPKFYWRYSGFNISATAYRIRNKTLLGFLQFTEWVVDHFEYLKATNSRITHDMMTEAAKANLLVTITQHYKGFGLNTVFRIAKLMRTKLRMPHTEVLLSLWRIKKATSPKVNRVIAELVAVKRLLYPARRNKYRSR